MRRTMLAIALSLPLVFAALPLGSLLLAERGSDRLPEAVVSATESVPSTPTEDPALAMRSEPGPDCSYTSTTHIDG